MPSSLTESRPFEPGTTGWTASDLDDPEIERQWFEGRYEIVEGVLTKMAPAYFVGGEALYRLMYFITTHIGMKAGSFATEVDIVIDEDRVVRSDAAFLTPEQKRLQKQAALAAGRADPKRTRILIPPLLIVECISPGHERYDEHTKRRWYAEFGVASYWILDPFKQTLKCLSLANGVYLDDALGKAAEEVRPSLFPGLILRLGEIWDNE
ncbi:MAG TPA: Uma2 family endonuclease [Tepidisphaeraceae bacterium]|jgi:Uma2 family endonuclease|nr:Uma2 family endonuclease [Tepidisphaeraceae bacterium]